MVILSKEHIFIALLGMIVALASACRHEQSNLAVQELAQRVAIVVANRHVFQINPNTVVDHFREIVELEPMKDSPYLLLFIGENSEIGVNWVQAEFQPRESVSSENWDLLQIRIALKPQNEDYAGLYDILAAEITDLLGQEATVTRMNADKRKAWNVAPYWEIAIRDGKFESPINGRINHLILVEVAVLQGEEDG